MDRCRAAWAQDKPHTLGHHSNSFRCRWIDLAADLLRALRSTGSEKVGTGSDCAGRWGTDGAAFLRGLLFAPAATQHLYIPPSYLCTLRSWPLSCLARPSPLPSGFGLALIVAGVLGIVWGAGGAIGSRQNIGHVMFIGAGMLWACYTVAMRKARLEGLHAAAIAAVGSLIAYVPVYAIVFGTNLFNVPWRDLALQAFVHGILDASDFIRALRTRGQHPWRVERLAFAALSPAMTASGHPDSRRMANGE